MTSIKRFLLMFLLSFGATIMSAAPFVVVIDPGHGGKDPGALGSITNEKTVNLRVAQKLEKLLNKKLRNKVKVIMTRDDDFFVTLGGRAEIANKAEADVFVSIHANSISSPKRRAVVSGASVYVRGFASSEQAREVARRENSSLKYESTKDSGKSAEESVISDLVWNRNLEESISLADCLLTELSTTAGRKRGAIEQNDLAVLKRTKMPAVLVELDYICNPHMEQFLNSSHGQEKLAKALTNGIVKFASKGHKNIIAPTKNNNKQTDDTRRETQKKSRVDTNETTAKTTYHIQFLISKSKIPENSHKLKGLKNIGYYSDGGYIKYYNGNYATEAEAISKLKQIRSLFSDAFIIKMMNGTRIK